MVNKFGLIDLFAKILVLIGGLNWGLIGILRIDLVAVLFGGSDSAALLPRLIYTLVGVSAVWMIYRLFQRAD